MTWFQNHVLHGLGPAWVLAKDYDDYERAIEAKLLRELELPIVSSGPASGLPAPG